MKLPFACLGAAACVGAIALAGRAASDSDLTFRSPAGKRASLVELYTSEGCSSCPPAEAWLSQLTSSPGLWTNIVPVAFHVDYWDNSGWRDRFASAAATERQRAYAASWGSSTVYTPGFVLDGGEWQDWSRFNAGELPTAKGDPVGAGQLSAVVKEGKTVSVVYHSPDRSTGPREVSVALLGFALNSNVKGGENRGRSLRHDFVSLGYETKKLTIDRSEGTAVFDLPTPPKDANRLALAIWVEEPGRPGVLQATGGWLNGAATPR